MEFGHKVFFLDISKELWIVLPDSVVIMHVFVEPAFEGLCLAGFVHVSHIVRARTIHLIDLLVDVLLVLNYKILEILVLIDHA